MTTAQNAARRFALVCRGLRGDVRRESIATSESARLLVAVHIGCRLERRQDQADTQPGSGAARLTTISKSFLPFSTVNSNSDVS